MHVVYVTIISIVRVNIETNTAKMSHNTELFRCEYSFYVNKAAGAVIFTSKEFLKGSTIAEVLK